MNIWSPGRYVIELSHEKTLFSVISSCSRWTSQWNRRKLLLGIDFLHTHIKLRNLHGWCQSRHSSCPDLKLHSNEIITRVVTFTRRSLNKLQINFPFYLYFLAWYLNSDAISLLIFNQGSLDLLENQIRLRNYTMLDAVKKKLERIRHIKAGSLKQ